RGPERRSLRARSARAATAVSDAALADRRPRAPRRDRVSVAVRDRRSRTASLFSDQHKLRPWILQKLRRFQLSIAPVAEADLQLGRKGRWDRTVELEKVLLEGGAAHPARRR